MKYDLGLAIDDRNALSLIIKQIRPHSTILEFGPANGRLTAYLKEELNCDVYIVEIDEEAAKDAAKYSVDAIVGDIEEFGWIKKWADVEFDYMIFADVLEHLHNPQEVLSRTKRLLKDEGYILLSVPNIAHNSIMINLFNNVFNYTSLGLLDNTHIHLFAYNTLKVFCNQAGYYPVIEDAVYVNVGENEIDNGYSDVNKSIAKELKNRKYGNVYQYVFTLQKIEYLNINTYVSDYRIKGYNSYNLLKIYVDRGNGWTEDNCITYKIGNQSEINFKAKLYNAQEIKNIRIDPLDANGVFKIKKIMLIDGNKDNYIFLNECNCNGILRADNFYCTNDDPQIIIKDVQFETEGVIEITIEYLFWDIDESVIQHMIELVHRLDEFNSQRMVIFEKDNEIKLLNEELKRRAAELDHRMDIINQHRESMSQKDNEIKLLSEELERRAAELDHRMDVINELKKNLEVVSKKKINGNILNRFKNV